MIKYKEEHLLQYFSFYFSYGVVFEYEFKTITNNIEIRKGECLGHRKQFNYIELLINNNADNPVWIDIREVKIILNPLSKLKRIWKDMNEEEQNIICNLEGAVLENMWQEPLFVIEILLKYHIDFYDLIGKKMGIKK